MSKPFKVNETPSQSPGQRAQNALQSRFYGLFFSICGFDSLAGVVTIQARILPVDFASNYLPAIIRIFCNGIKYQFLIVQCGFIRECCAIGGYEIAWITPRPSIWAWKVGFKLIDGVHDLSLSKCGFIGSTDTWCIQWWWPWFHDRLEF